MVDSCRVRFLGCCQLWVSVGGRCSWGLAPIGLSLWIAAMGDAAGAGWCSGSVGLFARFVCHGGQCTAGCRGVEIRDTLRDRCHTLPLSALRTSPMMESPRV